MINSFPTSSSSPVTMDTLPGSLSSSSLWSVAPLGGEVPLSGVASSGGGGGGGSGPHKPTGDAISLGSGLPSVGPAPPGGKVSPGNDGTIVEIPLEGAEREEGGSERDEGWEGLISADEEDTGGRGEATVTGGGRKGGGGGGRGVVRDCTGISRGEVTGEELAEEVESLVSAEEMPLDVSDNSLGLVLATPSP